MRVILKRSTNLKYKIHILYVCVNLCEISEDCELKACIYIHTSMTEQTQQL